MNLVVRCNYGNDSIALLMWLQQNPQHIEQYDQVDICYIDTGWAAENWLARVAKGEDFAHSLGFHPFRITATKSFDVLCQEQQRFPSHKFQWCAGFLKGLPMMVWLDEHDPACEWTIAIPKRQASYRKVIPSYIEQCEFHGERTVWHPILDLDTNQTKALVQSAGFDFLDHHSLECQPCINASPLALKKMAKADVQKVEQLESDLQKRFFAMANQSINQYVLSQQSAEDVGPNMDNFTMGCGDPFGCGL